MTKSDRKDFGLELTRLGAAYREDISRATAEVYFEELADFDLVDVRLAVRQAIRASKWLPKIAELRDGVSAIQRRRRESESNQRFLAEAKQQALAPPSVFQKLAEVLPLPGNRVVDMLVEDKRAPRQELPRPTPADFEHHEQKKAAAVRLLRAMESESA